MRLSVGGGSMGGFKVIGYWMQWGVGGLMSKKGN
jgi:hypothetical protein